MQGSDVARSSSLAGLGGVAEATGAAASRKSETAASGTGPGLDQATLSAAGGLVAASAGDGDVRLDKVASLKAAIDAGTYSVPSGDVAEKVISSLLR